MSAVGGRRWRRTRQRRRLRRLRAARTQQQQRTRWCRKSATTVHGWSLNASSHCCKAGQAASCGCVHALAGP